VEAEALRLRKRMQEAEARPVIWKRKQEAEAINSSCFRITGPSFLRF